MTTDALPPRVVERAPESVVAHDLWGELTVEHGQIARARVGRLRLMIYRSSVDWWLRATDLDVCNVDGPRDEAELEASWEDWSREPLTPDSFPPQDLGPSCKVRRVLLEGDAVEVLPALADRTMVVRPAAAVLVAPRSRVSLFVGTPLWIEVRVASSTVLSRAIHQPSDTWFGTTLEGELAYAARTHGRLQSTNLEFVPGRAFTRMDVVNALDSPFDFERVALPVPELSLYAGTRSAWTETVTLTRLEESLGDGHARLEIGEGPPAEASDGEPAPLLRSPRVQRSRQSRVRAFGNRALGALFG